MTASTGTTPRPYLLHLFTPGTHASPFDLNMAYDAGWDAVIPYAGVSLEEVPGLVQDAIFSRGPKGVRRTALFIGGRNVFVALDMLTHSRRAVVSPFLVSVLVDPSGAFTTAAALVALVASELKRAHDRVLRGARVAVFGATGPVGTTAAVLAACSGAHVRLVGHDGAEHVAELSGACARRFGTELKAVDGSNDRYKRTVLDEVDVVIVTAKAGTQVLSRPMLLGAPHVKVVADVNAVPPAGAEGVGVMDLGVPLAGSVSGAVGLGALAIGNIKYRVQAALLRRMRDAEEPLYLDHEAAFAEASAQT